MESDNLNLTAEELKRKRNREASVKYREQNRERFNQRMRDWREANRDKDREHKRENRNRKLMNGTPEEVAAIRKAESDKTKRLQAVCRDQVFEAYGGYKCNCCGENKPMFLSIDHVDNDGAIERKSGKYCGSGTGFYQWLRKNKFPLGYQVLCMNCNTGKHKNGGVCPHQTSLILKGI